MKYIQHLQFLACLLCSTLLLAEPVVIYKGEKVVSIDPYRLALKTPRPIEKVPIEVIRSELKKNQQQTMQTVTQSGVPGFNFPYKTEGLSLGKVEPRNIQKPDLPRPFFIMGSDEQSRAWLRKNKDRFIALGAIGFLVEAKNLEEFELVQETAEGVYVGRFQWNGMVQELGISHYPVLVTKTTIEQ